MLWTGGSACIAIKMLKDEGINNIKFYVLLVSHMISIHKDYEKKYGLIIYHYQKNKLLFFSFFSSYIVIEIELTLTQG